MKTNRKPLPPTNEVLRMAYDVMQSEEFQSEAIRFLKRLHEDKSKQLRAMDKMHVALLEAVLGAPIDRTWNGKTHWLELRTAEAMEKIKKWKGKA